MNKIKEWETVSIDGSSKYDNLKLEIELHGNYIGHIGPAFVYGIDANFYQYNNKQYAISWDMYGKKEIAEVTFGDNEL